MKRKSIFIGFCTVLMVFCGENVFAQERLSVSDSTFFPYKNPPPLSPWLELERRTSSDLDSYHQFVRPRLEMQRTMETQQRQLLRQRENQQILEQQVHGMQMRQSATSTQTGKGGVFRYYSHFFPEKRRR